MPRRKSEKERKDSSILVPMTRDLRRAVEHVAAQERAPLSEIGRRAFRIYLDPQARGRRAETDE